MSNSIMRDKAKEFAKNIVFLCRNMKSEHKEAVLINPLLRSSTSIGANIHEAHIECPAAIVTGHISGVGQKTDRVRFLKADILTKKHEFAFVLFYFW